MNVTPEVEITGTRRFSIAEILMPFQMRMGFNSTLIYGGRRTYDRKEKGMKLTYLHVGLWMNDEGLACYILFIPIVNRVTSIGRHDAL